MRIKLPTLLFTFTLVAPLYAGDLAETIFHSSFEFGEQCQTFDGLNDTLIVPTVHITGDFTLNGQAFPLSEYDDGVFSLRDRVTGNVFELGNSHDIDYAVNVIPGRYDVLYSVESPSSLVPANVGAVVMEDVELLVNGALDIDVTAFTISGEFRHNGVLFPANEYDDGLIFLDGENAGRVAVGPTKLRYFNDVMVLAGNYEVRYQVQSPGATVPWNEWGFAGLLNVAADANALQINVQSTTLSGTFSHNNVAMPINEYDDGNFYLETADGDRVFLENSHAGNFERQVAFGKYDVYWELESPGDTVPFNERARINSNFNVAGGTLDINMSSSAVSGDFLLNGNAFPNTIQNTGQVILHDRVTGTDNVLALTMDGSYDQKVLNGRYDIVYQHRQGDQVPENKNAVLSKDIVVKIPTTIDVDVPSVLYNTSVYHNGVLFPANAQEHANILLRDLSSGDRVLLGKTSQQNLSTLVVPGTYDVYYSYLNGVQIPRDTMARFMEKLVIAPMGPMLQLNGANDLQVFSTLISGNMLLNDGPMPPSEYDDGLLRLQLEENLVPLGNTHDQSYQVRLLTQAQGTLYWIHYGVETAGDTIPLNGDTQVMCVYFELLIL